MAIFTKKMLSSLLFFIGLLLCCTYGDDAYCIQENNLPLQVNLFKKDKASVQVMSGMQCSPVFFHKDLPTFNYARTSMRVGWMLTDPGDTQAFFRGNWEAVIDLSASSIVKGEGDYIAEFAILLRYNFLSKGSRFVPYLQGGAGLAYTDAYYYPAIGQGFNFTPQASVGLRFLVNNHLSIDAEGTFHHISNAGLDSRNKGVNSFGGSMGLTYYFDHLWR